MDEAILKRADYSASRANRRALLRLPSQIAHETACAIQFGRVSRRLIDHAELQVSSPYRVQRAGAIGR
jgi:hypothetical protein